MISAKDVLRLRIPYPSISDKLAISSHMYICKTANATDYEYVKCQTLKPYMLANPIFKHYVDEPADISRNPFQRTTRIDCDKTFSSSGLQYNDKLKTTSRPDICQELYDEIIRELSKDGYDEITMDSNKLMSINPLVTKI